MAELRTEEEQIAAIKDWWKENGNSLLISLGLVIAIAFGWKAYQNSVIQSKSEASALYEQVLAAATNVQLAGQSESNGVAYLAAELKEKFSGTEYAVYGALFLAKESAQSGDLESALAELEWVKSQTEDARLLDLVNGRIARIMSAQGKHDEALSLLNATVSEYESEFLEITGDIQLRKGLESEAVESYKEAYAMVKETPQIQPLLAVKLANLGVDVDQL